MSVSSLYNLKINHDSSLIGYIRRGPQWEIQGSGQDSYHITNFTYNKVVHEFTGSAVTVHGRSSRGFIVDLDSSEQRIETAPNATDVLYSNLDLEMGFHRLIIGEFDQFNNSLPFEFRLDDIVVGSTVGDPSANWTTQVVRSDDDSVATFGDTSRLDVGTYGSSVFVTGEKDADCGISFNFTGTSIAIYAPSQENGNIPPQRTFDVYFNSSAQPQEYDTRAYRSVYSGEPLQFQANGLPQGEHRVVMRCLRGSDRNRSLGFDHAVVAVPEVYTAPDLCFVNCTSNNTFKIAPEYIQYPGMVGSRANALLSLSVMMVLAGTIAATMVTL